MEKTKITSKYNTFYYYANLYYENATERSKIEEIDMTEEFYKELDTMVKKGEIIIIQANCKMRLGKSTAIQSLGLHIFELLKKHGLRDEQDKFSVKDNIAMDQMEFDYKMRDSKTTFTVILTDEDNKSEETGQDITAVKALQDDQSNIQADRYVYRLSASPTGITDRNTDIILDLVYIDDERMMTKANLTYRWYEQMTEKIQLIGHIWIPVGHIIENWITKVRKRFYEKLRIEAKISELNTQEEKDLYEIQKLKERLKALNTYIKEWEHKDFYVQYYMKKRRKIELVTKYKITKTRLIRYAPIIIQIINELKKMAKYGDFLNKDMVMNKVTYKMRQAGIPQSIIGQTMTTNEIWGTLSTYKAYWKTIQTQSKLRTKLLNGKILSSDYEIENQDLEEFKQTLMKNVQEQIDEYENCIKLLQEYDQEYA